MFHNAASISAAAAPAAGTTAASGASAAPGTSAAEASPGTSSSGASSAETASETAKAASAEPSAAPAAASSEAPIPVSEEAAQEGYPYQRISDPESENDPVDCQEYDEGQNIEQESGIFAVIPVSCMIMAVKVVIFPAV